MRSPRLYPRPLDAQVRLLTKVARMYHERGIRQAEIAAALGISQAKVSRLLKRAVQTGIVRTIVSVAPGIHAELEEALEERFGLSEAVVVDIDDDADAAEVRAAIGAGAASHLEATLGGSDRIGVSTWSETLRAMVDRLQLSPAPRAAEVVQLLGGVGTGEQQNHAQRLLGDLARLLGADPVFVQAPGIVADARTREGLMATPALREVASHWDTLTLAVVGIGRLETSEVLAGSGNAFTAAESARLRAEGAVGDICHRVFRRDGTRVDADVDERIVAIDEQRFRAIRRRIGVAGGPDKVDAVHGALRGGWVDVVVTDLATARTLAG